MTHRKSQPYRVIHWHDIEETGAVGWLVIDRLINGSCGGGVFIDAQASLEETKDLAHTMSLKNTLCQPQLGGGKAGIRFDPRDPRAEEVLRRFLIDHRFFIKNFWYTGADLNTSNQTILKIIQQDLHLPSPLFCLAKTLEKRLGFSNHLLEVNQRIGEPINSFFRLYEAATGFSVSQCVKEFSESSPKIIIQGFGAVGSSLAYFINKYQLGRVVAISDHEGYLIDPEGIDVEELLSLKKQKKLQGSSTLNAILDDHLKSELGYTSRDHRLSDEDYLLEFISQIKGDIFCPCATRYQLTPSILKMLHEKTFASSPKGIGRIISGANNIFRDPQSFHLMKRLKILMIPEWVSNSGNALLFVEALTTNTDQKSWTKEALETIQKRLSSTIFEARQRIHRHPSHLYEAFYANAENKINNPHIIPEKAFGLKTVLSSSQAQFPSLKL